VPATAATPEGGPDGATAEAEPPDPLIGRRIGDYLVVRLEGRGGFGRVYLALQLPIGMKAALKLLDTQGMPEPLVAHLREKFEGEARALSVLRHPNIVGLLHYGLMYGRPYLVMEYLEQGRLLSEEIEARAEQGRCYEAPELRDRFSQLLDGLAAAHARDIIHRDIKPDNLMLQPTAGGPRRMRIMDFGLAKFVTHSGTTVQTVGTPEYMAPEQLENKNLGPWTDLYAVGVMFYELITGRVPFPATSMQEVFKRKLDASFDPVEALAGYDYPTSARRLLRRALARRPADRFQRADEMKQELGRCLDELLSVESRPLARVRLSGLLEPRSGDEQRTADLHTRAPDPTEARLQSDRAFRRWLEREAERLERTERELAKRRGSGDESDSAGDGDGEG
jgi:serine/threonine-protein kinase